MSNSIFNIRFGFYHLIIEHSPFRVRWSRNNYQKKLRDELPDWRWFQLYEAPWL